MITGRCECGKVQYEVKGELKDYCHCHCSICRRIHGAAFATWGGISRDKFTYLSGENNLKIYSYSERSDSIFCDNCGYTLFGQTNHSGKRYYRHQRRGKKQCDHNGGYLPADMIENAVMVHLFATFFDPVGDLQC